MRSGAKRVALALASLLVSGALAEGVYRIATRPDASTPDGSDDDWRQRYNHMNESIYRASEDPRLVYEPNPSSAVEMEYGVAGFNAGSMRAADEPALEPGPDRRVAIVGDSLVWSEFLPVHEALPQRIDTSLGGGWEVLNFGVSGYDTSDEAAWYERHVRRYAPEIVVVVFCMNDMMIMSGPFERFASEADRARKDAQEALLADVAPVRRETIDDVVRRQEEGATFKLWARLQGILARREFDAHYDDEYLAIARQRDALTRFTNALGRLGASITRSGARALLVISPVLESWDDYHWYALHGRVRALAEDAGFTVLDPLDGWRESEDVEGMRVPGDNLHYDQSGNRLFADTLAAFIRSAP